MMMSAKIERAKQHTVELQGEINSFLATQPYKIDTKRDPKTKRLIYYLVDVKDVPEKVALITGDVIQNLRSALDQLAYQFFVLNSRNAASARHVYFPIAKDVTSYNSEKNRKTTGLSSQAKTLIDGTKPYKNGNNALWQIHELNNIDKHRLLVTVGSSFRSLDIGASMQEQMIKAFPQLGKDIPKISLFVKPADTLFPLKAGDELFIDLPDAKEVPHMQFRFDIVLNEPGIIEGQPVIEALNSMTNSVEGVIAALTP